MPTPAVPMSADPALRHRTAEAIVTVLDADGLSVAGTDVTVEQTRHAFGFGNIGFDFLPLANGDDEAAAGLEDLAELWLDLYNNATLPFYWGRFEPVRGQPQTDRLRATAEWFRDRGIALKGHPLVWHTVKAEWLDPLPLDEVERTLRARVRREVSEFAGLIDTWDAINEAVIMPVFTNEPDGVPNAVSRLAYDRGRIHILRLAFDEARAANPQATLLLNDFDLSSAYECLVEAALEAGIGIDAIGLQTHMHQGYRGEEWMLATVDRFARYGLPMHLTETSLVSGELMPPEIVDLNDHQPASWPSTPEGEERQASEIVRHYRSLVSHPAVQAITYWGISDTTAWLGAPSGLVRADGSPKPSYAALHGLIKGEWWVPPTTLRTDLHGRVRVAGLFGDYRVTAAGRSADLSLSQAGAVDVTAQVG